MVRPRQISDRQILDVTRTCVTEHGPGVSLAHIASRLGVTAAALLHRFGSKQALVFQALLPRERPDWHGRLAADPEGDPLDVVVDVLVEVYESFERVGPALAALRMTDAGTDRVFPPGEPGPPVRLRAALSGFLDRHGLVHCDADVAADLLLGAVEARGFLLWVGPQMVAPVDEARRWVRGLVEALCTRR